MSVKFYYVYFCFTGVVTQKIYKTHLFGSPSIIVCSSEACKCVLMNDEQLGPGWPIATSKLFGELISSDVSNTEYKHIRRQVTILIKGHGTLAKYIGLIENNVINELADLSKKDKPIEFLCEIKKFAYNVIAHIFLGVVSDSVFESVEKNYADLLDGLMSPPINFPGFAFHRALKVNPIEFSSLLEKLLFIIQS